MAADVVLLVRADTGVLDDSTHARALTVVGNAARTTTNFKYGGGALTFDGAGDWIQAADSADFTFGAGDFTVEGWFRHDKLTNDMLGHWSNTGVLTQSSWFLWISSASNGLVLRTASGGSTQDLVGTFTFVVGQWYHIAIDRQGNTLRLYVDGAVVATNSSFTATLNDCPDPFTLGAIGTTNNFSTNNYSGQMDDIRVTKGLARYAGAFTPPGPLPVPVGAPTRVQTTPQVRASNTASVAVTFASPPTVGNSIVVTVITYGSGTPVLTCTDNRGNTYVSARTLGSGLGVAAIFFCDNVITTGSPFTVTIASTPSLWFEACAIEVSGRIAINQTLGQTGSSATPGTGNTPLTASNIFVVGVVTAMANQTAITVETGTPSWTQELENLNYSATVAGEADSRSLTGYSGTQSCSWTLATTASWMAVLAVFRDISEPQPALPLGFVNSAQGNNYSGTNIATLSTASIILTTGNLVTVMVRGGACTVADTLGNVYTLRGQGASSAPIWIFSCANCIGGTTTITVTFTPAVNYVSIVAMQFSGAAASGELIGAFTTPLVTTGQIIDLTYNSGGFVGYIVVGIADVFASGSFGFSALTSESSITGYIEPVADHQSASFFYRIGDEPVTAAMVRATCTATGVPQKNFLVAVFKSTSTGITTLRVTQEVIETLTQPLPQTQVTQVVVESLSQPITPVRVTQDVVEVLANIGDNFSPDLSEARVSQVAAEVMFAPLPAVLMVSQAVVEVMVAPPPEGWPIWLSQVAVEVMILPGPKIPITAVWVGGGGGIVWVE